MASLSLGPRWPPISRQGAVPALLVFLVPKLDLSYTLAAAVVLVATFSSSIIQPLFGHWSDRRGAMWLLPAGVALAGAGIALAAVAPSYPLLLLAVSRLGDRRRRLPSGGIEVRELRQRLAPRERHGGVLGRREPGLRAGPARSARRSSSRSGSTAAFCSCCPGIAGRRAPPRRGEATSAASCRRRRARGCGVGERDQPRAFALLLGVVGLRSIAHYGLFTFVPLWEVAKGASEQCGDAAALALPARGRGRDARRRPARRPVRPQARHRRHATP